MECLRKKQPVVCRDILTDKRFVQWHKEARAASFLSTAAAPMICDDRLFGILNVYAAHVDFFDNEEIDLLMELTSDLAFGLKSIEEESGHKRADKQLIESEEKYRTIFESFQDVYYQTDLNGKITIISPSIKSACRV